MSEIRVTGLNIFPIKSCRGISLSEMPITHTGPLYDRGWMLVDENNQFITLRTHSKLSQIHTQILENNLIVSFNQKKLSIQLNQQSMVTETVVVQDVTLQAGIESDEINFAFSDFLQQNVKLVRYQKESFRDLEAAQTEVSKQTMFVDSRPILLTNENSLTAVNQRLKENNLQPSMMDRYRANIIISGLPAFTEEKIKSIQIGHVKFTNSKMCSRCVIVNMDYSTGETALKQTLKYLPLHETSKGPRITFGQYLTPESLGVIQLNDVCQIEFN
jgi:uncharacterized protein